MIFAATAARRATRPTAHLRQVDVAFSIELENAAGLVLSLSEGHRAQGRMGGRAVDAAPRVGAITLLPPGLPSRFALTGPARALMLRLPWPEMLDWLAEDHELDPARVELVPQLHANDPVLARLLLTAASGAAEDAPERMRAIAARLLASHSARAPARALTPRRGGLAPIRLRRVLDRIETGLADRLSLGDFAAEAGMSPFHFAREFRRSVGVSPHQHVIRRRVERAMAALAQRGRSVAEIAREHGFAGSSHLARHMRREMGLTPTAYRDIILA